MIATGMACDWLRKGMAGSIRAIVDEVARDGSTR
jgi:hypothetical protein